MVRSQDLRGKKREPLNRAAPWGLLRWAGVHLAEDPDVRMEINRGSAATLESVLSRPIRAERPPSSLTRSRHGICQLIEVIELSVGSDAVIFSTSDSMAS